MSSTPHTGTVYTFTTVFRQGREFAPRRRAMSMPYTIVVIEPDGQHKPGIRREAGWVEGASSDNGVAIGARVVAAMSDGDDDTGVQYRVVSS